MITENEVMEIISREFPEVKNELLLKSSMSTYKTIEYFVDFTKEFARNGNISKVKRCFFVAENLLEEGNKVVKNAVENVYVYSIGTFICSVKAVIILSPTSSIRLKELFSGALRREYYNQLKASGI